MTWEIVIGIEAHVQLCTQTKLFSNASTAFGAPPNTQIAPVDIALPGTLPLPNRKAVEHAIRFGLAIGGTVASVSLFARKNYFYPDLPKGYQISQHEGPIVENGQLQIQTAAGEKYIHIARAHLEEDAGKSLHAVLPEQSGIDLNRAGTPLLEIVTDPDLRSPEEAVAYAKALHALVVWIGISDGNMQEGSFRCDANVSVRPLGEARLGTRSEIKNLNSFKFLEKAIRYEAKRQIALIEQGDTVLQETRLFDPTTGKTQAMRSKENADDYRYFPDPDLPPLCIAPEWIETIKASLPELPTAMRAHFCKDYGVSPTQASQLTAHRALATYFEATVTAGANVKQAVRWITGEMAAMLKREEKEISEVPISSQNLAEFIQCLTDGTLNALHAKDVFRTMWRSQQRVKDCIGEDQTRIKNDVAVLKDIVDQVCDASPHLIAAWRAGNEKALNALVGQGMKTSGGKANPEALKHLLLDYFQKK